MLKYLLLFLVALWLWHSPAIRGLLKGKKPQASPRPTPQPRPGPTPNGGEPDRIVPCAHCGVHLPFKDAVLDIGGRVYCGDAHRNAGPRSP